ncbi:MAG TPA: MFS transporter, partial [Janibacter terrae]|nr:MFS transporter [Janibacter terrae]
MLAMATLGFAINFWAWALISPLGPLFRKTGYLGELSEMQVSLLVAVPVVVGSLGRIIAGAMTDRYGGRVMFPIITALTILPVLFIAFIAIDSYSLLIFAGFFLGIAGTIFAVGVPFVNAWFPPARRGLAIGIFGAGMGGTAISALTTVRLFEKGAALPFVITAALLAVYAVAAWLIMRDAPGRVAPTTSLGQRLRANATLPVTWMAGILYAVAFGGYVAFSVYLPAYLITAHDLDAADASYRMAGFVVVAVIMRPVGGAMADKLGAIPVLGVVFAVTAVCAAMAAGNPPLHAG